MISVATLGNSQNKSHPFTRYSAIACVLAMVACSSSDDTTNTDGGAEATIETGGGGAGGAPGIDAGSPDAQARADAVADVSREASTADVAVVDAPTRDVVIGDVGITADEGLDALTPPRPEAAVDAAILETSVEAAADVSVIPPNDDDAAVVVDAGPAEASTGFMADGCTAETFPHRTPSSATILDMEASEKFTQAVPPNEAGNWLQLLPDAAAGMTATSSPYDVVLITPAPRGASLHAIHSTGSGYDGVGGVGMALLDQFRAPLDASAYIGIAFYARGSALTPGLTVQAGLNTVLPEMCMCDPGPPSRCNDQPTHDVVLTADWQRYTIIWADFKQDGYGNPVPTDPTRLTNFGFRANPAVDAGTRGAWDFWLDDVSFITTTTP